MNISFFSNYKVCRECTEETGRTPGCHDRCERYLKEKEEIAEMRDREKKDNIADIYLKKKSIRFSRRKQN